MVKKKLPFKAFEKCSIPTSKRQSIKGGYKYIPEGVQGNNFIGSTIDIRRNSNRVASGDIGLPNAIDYLIQP